MRLLGRRDVPAADAWQFVDFEPQPVSGGMEELALQTVAFQGAARGATHGVGGRAGLNGVYCRELRFEHRTGKRVCIFGVTGPP
jgi:hypothetical protein